MRSTTLGIKLKVTSSYDSFSYMIEIQTLPESQLRKSKSDVLKKLPFLAQGKVMVIGDLCLDEYLLGDVKRISPEAPVPVVDVQTQEVRIGLAANVAQNVVSLGGQCVLIGVVGKDQTAKELKDLLGKAGVKSENLLEDETRPTTRKTRIMSGNHHIVRVDYEKRQFLSAKSEKKMLELVEANLKSVDVVVIEDYAKGTFSQEGTQKIIAMAQSQKKFVAADPHRSTPVDYYRGANLFKPNRDEAFILSGLNLDDLRENKDSLAHVSAALVKKIQCQNLIVTLGKDGMLLVENGKGVGIPTQALQTFDVTGAGDTVLAALALGVAAKFSLIEAGILANCAAGVVVGKVGCVPCFQKELIPYLEG